MNIEVEIRTYLLTLSALTTLIGQRIHIHKYPQDAIFPLVTYMKIASKPTYSHSGDSNLTRVLIQFNCWGKTYLSALGVAEVLIEQMSGFKGTAGVAEVYAIYVEGVTDIYDPEAEIYQIPVDLMIHYNG